MVCRLDVTCANVEALVTAEMIGLVVMVSVVWAVGVVQAPDMATVQTDEALVTAKLQQAAGQGISFIQVQGVGDAAAEVQASRSSSGTTIALCGIYVVKGLIFFFITDVAVNHAVPSNSALQAQATTVLSRL